MWYQKSFIYQIYPLGLCGAPPENDGYTVPRIQKIEEWIPHIQKLGADTILLNPVFDSDRHGYDTRDYFNVDPRLGTNEDLAALCRRIHAAGMRVLFDGVFHHVGRGFWAFQDVLKKRQDSPYKDWFHLDFSGNTERNDGFWYADWEGHSELVKLNLWNPAVTEHQFSAIRQWTEQYGIDGLRLDVAYCLPPEYIRQLRGFTDRLKPDFLLLGEAVHGDYNRWMGAEGCHAMTNYECYKGIWSALNSDNLFEICHSLARQFGPEPWTLYKGVPLLSFLDNHDVSRIATQLCSKELLPIAYGLLFAMPGVPAVYYGSEWGLEGSKQDGDAALRPAIEQPQANELTAWIAKLAAARKSSPALYGGSFHNLLITNKQAIWERAANGDRVLAGFNIDAQAFHAHFDAGCSRATDLLSGQSFDFSDGVLLPPHSVFYWQTEE